MGRLRKSIKRRRVLGRPDDSEVDPRISKIFKFLTPQGSDWSLEALEYPDLVDIKAYPAHASIVFHFKVSKDGYSKWMSWCGGLLRIGSGLGLDIVQRLKYTDGRLSSDWVVSFEVLVEDREHYHVRLFEAMQQLENMLKIVR